MTQLFYARISDPLSQVSLNAYLAQLPATLTAQILRYKRWEDRQASLYGKLLLHNGLLALGYDRQVLTLLQYTAHKRPYLSKELDFNISHSGEYVVCVISDSHRIGVDIEKVEPIDINDFLSVWTDEEWQQIQASKSDYTCFYNFWTQKEAVIKADGKGFSIPLQNIKLLPDLALLDSTVWHLSEVKLAQNYIMHLATSQQMAQPPVLTQCAF